MSVISVKWWWCKKWCCVLLSFIAFIILPNLNNGFNLKGAGEEKKSLRELPPFQKITKIVHVDDDGNEIITDFKFEKVHKTSFPIKAKPIFKTIAEDVEKEEDAAVEEASEKLAWSFSSLLGIFSTSTTSESKSTSEETPPAVEINQTQSNGIIDWIKSFKSKNDSDDKPSEIPPESSSSIMTYLNRWPFNVFFPFGKPGELKASQMFRETGEMQFDKNGAPLSQEDFEFLLHKLPNFILNPADAENIECKKHLHIFHRQLRGHKIWTLQMIDASAKIPSGILRGNINQFGDFDQCTNIKTVVKIAQDQSVRIKGKYCLAHIEVVLKNDELKVPLYLTQGRGLWNSHLENPSHFIPRYTIVNWGVCIPNSCAATDVLHMLESTVRPYNNTGLMFKIQVPEEDCYVRKKPRIFNLLVNNWKISFTVGLFTFFTTLVFLATIFDNWAIIKKISPQYLKYFFETTKKDNNLTKGSNPDEIDDDKKSAEVEDTKETEGTEGEEDCPQEKEKQNIFKQIILTFSARRTFNELINAEFATIKCLPILRVISTVMLYVTLKFLLIGHLPITNRDKFIKTFEHPLNIIIRSPLLYFDILLLINGLLSAQKIHQENQQNFRISIIKRIMGNFLRYLPSLYLILLFQTWILPQFGIGPLWNTLIGQNSQICEKHLWRNFFAIQNVLDFDETCSPMTIQLAVEMQLFLLTPLLVWLYNSNGDIGFMVYGIIHAISVAIRYSRTNIDNLSPTLFHGMNLSKFYRTANISFSSPIHRATAYLIGVGIGLLLGSDYNRSRFSKTITITGSISAILCIIWCFWYPSNNMSSEFIYDPTAAATYASWAPLLLSLAIGWIIFMTYEQEWPQTLETALLSKPIIVISKISYPLQLVMYTVALLSIAEHKETIRFQISDLINPKEVIVIISFAIFLCFLVDIPFRRLRKLLLESGSKEEITATLDEEMLEDDVKFTEADDIKLGKEEEAVDDIWGSDAEKDDQSNSRGDTSSPELDWNKFETNLQSWRTENDLDNDNSEIDTIVLEIQQTSDLNDKIIEEDEPEETEEEHEQEKGHDQEQEQEDNDENDEDDQEINEEDEIIRRPVSPTPKPSFRRRRWNLDED